MMESINTPHKLQIDSNYSAVPATEPASGRYFVYNLFCSECIIMLGQTFSIDKRLENKFTRIFKSGLTDDFILNK